MGAILFTFYNTHGAIAAEQAMRERALPVEVATIPAAISAGCGLCVQLPAPDYLQRGMDALAACCVTVQDVYIRDENGYRKQTERGSRNCAESKNGIAGDI